MGDNNYIFTRILGSTKYFFLFLLLLGMFLGSGVGISLFIASRAGERTTIIPADPTLSTTSTTSLGLSAGQTLTVNSELQVNGQFYLAPSTLPQDAKAGTIVFDQTTNTLQYFDGQGFSAVATQASIPQAAVVSVQGQTGAINFTPGSGISINGTTISSSGLLGVNGVGGTINVTTANGIASLSLPQDIAPSATPTFAGLTLDGITVTEFEGRGLDSSSGILGVRLQATNQGGLQLDGTGNLSLLTSCNASDILKFISNAWVCDQDQGGATSPSLQGAYNNYGGIVQAIITLNDSQKGIRIRDNATPITASSLFAIQSNAGTNYLDVIPATTTIGNDLVVSDGGDFDVDGTVTINRTSGGTAIGNNASTFQLDSNTLDVSAAGALSGITGYGQVSGNFAITGTGTFSTGTGAISLQGNVTIGTGSVAGQLLLTDGTGNNATLRTGGASLAQSTVYSLPSVAGVGNDTASICVLYGAGGSNCFGTGGGFAGTVSTNRIPVATGAGQLGDSSISDVSGVVTGTGSLNIQGSLGISIGNTTTPGLLRFNDSAAGNNFASIQGPSSTAGYTLILPAGTAGGGNGGYCLKDSDGAGTLTWGACLGTSGPTPDLAGVYAASTAGGVLARVTLNSTSQGIYIRDAATPIVGDLFNVQSNDGLTKYLAITPTATTVRDFTVTAGETFTINNEGFTDLTGNGLEVVTTGPNSLLSINLDEASVGNSGLTLGAGGLSLVTSCSDNQILKWNDVGNVWACAADNGAGPSITLQDAYTNYAGPNDAIITIDTSSLGLRIRDTSTPQAGANPVFAVQNNTGSTNYLFVNATGTSITGTGTISGTLAVQGNTVSVGTDSVAGSLFLHNSSAGANGITLSASSTSNYALTLPTSAGSVNQCLKKDSIVATQLVWDECLGGGGGGGGVTTVGTFSGSGQTNGATISGSTITFGPATSLLPGMVSTGAQTFAGIKTFTLAPTIANGINFSSSSIIAPAYNSGGAGYSLSLYSGSGLTSGGNVTISAGSGSSTFGAQTTIEAGAANTGGVGYYRGGYGYVNGGYAYLQGGAVADGGTISGSAGIDAGTCDDGCGGYGTVDIGLSYASAIRIGTTNTAPINIGGANTQSLNLRVTSLANITLGNPTADGIGTQLVLDRKNTAGDPTGVDGGMYYNSNINGGEFRCFKASAWGDCGGAGDYKQNGNSFGTAAVLGTNDNFGLNLRTNGMTALSVDVSQNVSIGSIGTTTSQFYVSGKLPTASMASVSTGTAPASIAMQGRYIYVVNRTSSTLQIFDASNPTSPVVAGSVATATDPFAVVVQDRYAYILTTLNGGSLQIINISNPASPVSVSTTTVVFSNVQDIVAQGRYVYITGNNNGQTLVYDISNPTAPVNVGVALAGFNRFVTKSFIKERYLYSAVGGISVGLYVTDISNPAVPVGVGILSTGTNPTAVYVQGRYAYLVDNNANNLKIIDVKNPTSPILVSTITTGVGSLPYEVFVQGRYAFVLNQFGNNFIMYDVSDPANPINIGTVSTGANPSSLHVQGRYVYVSNATPSTLQVFDLGGSYIQQFEAGGIETGTLETRGNAIINGNQVVTGGVSVGQSLQVSGGFSSRGQVLFSSSSDSLNAFQIQTASNVSLLTVDTTNSSTIFNRGFDGKILSFQSGGVEQGTINVAAGTVSYNAFTGSHYGLFDGTSASRGELVDLTGNNQYKQGSSEPIYGITKTSTANSPTVLGAYLSTQDPSNPTGLENPELITAAGNGEVWVADNGSGNVMIGDPLISSGDVAGHAMRDIKSFPTSHIFAKSAESIDWDTVTTTVSGIKVAKITVLFSYYNQDNSTIDIQGGSLNITGNSILNGNLSILSDLNVSGNTSLTSLTVTGSVTIQQTLTVQGNTTIAGNLTVGGKIITGGQTPVVEAGTDANGAIVTITGNDTSATITITTGSNVDAGELAKITFAEPFANKPRIVLTPANRVSAEIKAYYDIDITTTDQFSVFSSEIPQPNTTYTFTYFIVE